MNHLTEPVVLTLPFPPSANRYWRMGNGRMYVSPEASDYKALAAWKARAAGVIEMITGPVVCTAHFHMARKNRDLSNCIKVLEDAMNGIVWVDDVQVQEWHCYRHLDHHNPRVELTVIPAEEAAPID